MTYVSLYRKWRPQVFADVVGQEHVVRTLTNALSSGKLGHAYLFSGPRGTGKTTVARLLAKGLNCEHGPTGNPCGQCDRCVRIAQGASVDVLEIDGASNRGIDEIREIREKVKYAPAEGAYKIYIIDEVHMLTTEAFNALLKVLEEPPRHVVFVFATTESHKIPATIVSRCQSFDFRSFTPGEIIAQLRQVAHNEGIDVQEEALSLIARHAEGGMRDALGLLDQCIAFSEGAVDEALAAQLLGVAPQEALETLADALADNDLGRCLLWVQEAVDAGRDLRQLATDAARYLRDVLLVSISPNVHDAVVMSEQARARAGTLATRFGLKRLARAVEAIAKAESDMRHATSPRLALEIALIELTRTEDLGADGIDQLTQRVEELERSLKRVLAGAAPLATTAEERSAVRGHVGLPQSPAAVPETGSERAAVHGQDQPQREAVRPAPTSDPGDHDLLSRVQSIWPQLLTTLRARKAVQQEAFLREGYPGAVHGETITVYFSVNHRFHQANIENEKNRVVVETVLGQLLGREVRIRTELGTPPARPESARREPTPGTEPEKAGDPDGRTSGGSASAATERAAEAPAESAPGEVGGTGLESDESEGSPRITQGSRSAAPGPGSGPGFDTSATYGGGQSPDPSPTQSSSQSAGPEIASRDDSTRIPSLNTQPSSGFSDAQRPSSQADTQRSGSQGDERRPDAQGDARRPGSEEGAVHGHVPLPDVAAEGVPIDPDEIDEPIIKEALKMFGGTIIKIERKGDNS